MAKKTVAQMEEVRSPDDLVELVEEFVNELPQPRSGSEVKLSNAASVDVQCPRCRSLNTIVESTRPWSDGIRVRYHRCRGCRLPFKSTEEAPVTNPIDTTENLCDSQ